MHSRALVWILSIALFPLAASAQQIVHQWDVYELILHGPSAGNPFVDVDLTADFTNNAQHLTVHGFYNGNGEYRVRFMPQVQGQWSYHTHSNSADLSDKTGAITCGAPAANNHGPVRVANTWHFAYADGTPYIPVGTTCYAWVDQPDALEDQTLASLRASPFNKARMMLLPGKSAPLFYPYAQDAAGYFDQTRFNPEFFSHYEKRIQQLADQGIEADVILFNPYHKGAMAWFDKLDNAADDRYLHYVVARLAAYRNVWWSLANEYSQIKTKTDVDWDHFFQLIAADDPYNHLRSIHNAAKFYDYDKPWVTHASIQAHSAVADFGGVELFRQFCRKPLVLDEVGYEGNIDRRWGDLSGQEMVKQFWIGAISGAYVGHGETFSSKPGISWTSEGGSLVGQSPPRIAFLKKILETGPTNDIEPIDPDYQSRICGKAGEYYLIYFADQAPTQWPFNLPRDPAHKTATAPDMKFHVDVLDTWNMTVTPIDREFKSDGTPVPLPGKPYLALRIQRIEP